MLRSIQNRADSRNDSFLEQGMIILGTFKVFPHSTFILIDILHNIPVFTVNAVCVKDAIMLSIIPINIITIPSQIVLQFFGIRYLPIFIEWNMLKGSLFIRFKLSRIKGNIR